MVLLLLVLSPFRALAGGAGEIVVVVAGDVFLGARAAPYIKANGVLYPFEPTVDILRGADLALANLEGPLTGYSDIYMEKEYLLKAPPSFAAGLKEASIDVLTLANNHMMDYGVQGLEDTLRTLDKVGIAYTGAGLSLAEARRPAVVEVKGARVAVLSYSKTFPKEFYARGGTRARAGTAPGYESFISSDVSRAASEADIVIVAFHWGGERVKLPRPYQQKLGRLAIDSGAQLVIGHHPHVVQGVEEYNGGLIVYSLGNYVFGFYSSPSTEGMMVRVVFEIPNAPDGTTDGGFDGLADKVSFDGLGEEVAPRGFRIKTARLIPLDVDNRRVLFSPRPLKRDEARAVLKEVRLRSRVLNSPKLDLGLGDIIMGFPEPASASLSDR